MKKLEDIPKNNIYKVPEGYFESLPNIIQARIGKQADMKTSPGFGYVLRYAIPVAVIAIATLIYINRQDDNPINAEEMLASIEMAALEDYLEEEHVIAYNELADEFGLTGADADEIEDMLYFNLEETDAGEKDMDEFLLEEYVD